MWPRSASTTTFALAPIAVALSRSAPSASAHRSTLAVRIAADEVGDHGGHAGGVGDVAHDAEKHAGPRPSRTVPRLYPITE